jgi:hypothetical protein
VDVVDLDDVICVEVVEVVLLCDDSLCVQMASVDSCDNCLVVLVVDVVLNDECLACGELLLDCLLDDDVIVCDPS